MSNPDFDTEMLELLANTQPLPPEAYPLCFHCPDGDMLEIVLSPESYYQSWPNPGGVAERWSCETDGLVGFVIYGLSKRVRPADMGRRQVDRPLTPDQNSP